MYARLADARKTKASATDGERAGKRLGVSTVTKVQETLMLGALSCPLCMGLLVQPITSTSGHTYCKLCLHKLVQHTPPGSAICDPVVPSHTSSASELLALTENISMKQLVELAADMYPLADAVLGWIDACKEQGVAAPAVSIVSNPALAQAMAIDVLAAAGVNAPIQVPVHLQTGWITETAASHDVSTLSQRFQLPVSRVDEALVALSGVGEADMAWQLLPVTFKGSGGFFKRALHVRWEFSSLHALYSARNANSLRMAMYIGMELHEHLLTWRERVHRGEVPRTGNTYGMASFTRSRTLLAAEGVYAWAVNLATDLRRMGGDATEYVAVAAWPTGTLPPLMPNVNGAYDIRFIAHSAQERSRMAWRWCTDRASWLLWARVSDTVAGPLQQVPAGLDDDTASDTE